MIYQHHQCGRLTVVRRRLQQSTSSVLSLVGKHFRTMPSLCSLPILAVYVTDMPINVIWQATDKQLRSSLCFEAKLTGLWFDQKFLGQYCREAMFLCFLITVTLILNGKMTSSAFSILLLNLLYYWQHVVFSLLTLALFFWNSVVTMLRYLLCVLYHLILYCIIFTALEQSSI